MEKKAIAYFKDMVVDIVEQLITTIVMVSVFLLTLVGSLIYINNNPYQFKKLMEFGLKLKISRKLII